jgi:hypothetical protein
MPAAAACSVAAVPVVVLAVSIVGCKLHALPLLCVGVQLCLPFLCRAPL